jgi:RimJ/RimL family protein N-acetyltransferase
MKLKPLSISDMEPIRNWRNEQLAILRTSFPLTLQQQVDFYSEVVCNRRASAKYWGIFEQIETDYVAPPFDKLKPIIRNNLIGMAGIENIQWENRLGEISLLLIPNTMDKYGEEALELILREGFMNMNLENIFTEVYKCSPYFKFWEEQTEKYKKHLWELPNRKFYNGNYYNSIYINFNKGECYKA